MPADKPLGAFDATANVATYPHAADLVWAYEFDGTVGASTPSSPDVGSATTSIGWTGVLQSEPAPHLRSIDDADRGYPITDISYGAFELIWVATASTWAYAELLGRYATGHFVFEYNGTVFKIFDSDGFTGETSSFAYSPTIGDVIHAFVIWSAGSFRLRLYVNGVLQGDSTHSSGSYASLIEPKNTSPSGERDCVAFRHYNAVPSTAEMDQNALGASWEPYAVVGASLGSAPFTGAAEITAVASMSVTGTVIAPGAATLDTIAAVAAAGTVRAFGSAAPTAVADVAAAGTASTPLFNGQASIDAVGDVASTGSVIATGAANPTVVGDVSAVSGAIVQGASEITSTAEVTSGSNVTAYGASNPTATAAADATGQVTASGASTISAVATVVAEAIPNVFQGVASITATATVQAVATVTKFGATTIDTVASMWVRFASAASGLGQRVGGFIGKYIGKKT